VSTGKILFFAEEIQFLFKDKNKIRHWIRNCLHEESKDLGTVNFVFCNDAYLLQLNIKYLGHHTLTDILTFNNSEDGRISGDIFISIERVKENCVQYKTTFSDELHRVMVHGILHLCGYNDSLKSEKAAMRSKEDYYLSLRPQFS
jgi:probable rRNA maturation factor